MFSRSYDVILHVSRNQAWDMLISADQGQWNHAVKRLEASFGFHTGSSLVIELRSLKGSWHMEAEVLQSVPPSQLYLQSTFRCFFLKHLETWRFDLTEIDQRTTQISASYELSGPFSATLWRDRSYLVQTIISLWLESLKAKLERM